jgi:putative transposase
LIRCGTRDIVLLFVHLIVTAVRLAQPGGLRSVVAESALLRHQLLILNRGRKRAPNLRASDRIIAGLCALFMRPARVLRSAIALKPSTLLHFHHVLTKRKYRRRILGMPYSPVSGSGGPSWLTFLGHVKDSLWSIDLFCCESLTLRTHWVLVVMDQFTRRIVGFGIRSGTVDGPALCRMSQHAIRRQCLPKYLSSDNDPLYRFISGRPTFECRT